ncbi:MAG: DNA translocase FtsK 4TM domain-containing protein, partial [Caulobacteraceae bacterium]
MARGRRRAKDPLWSLAGKGWSGAAASRAGGLVVAASGAAFAALLITYHAGDPSLDASAAGAPANALGGAGATIADLAVQTLGLTAGAIALMAVAWGGGRPFGHEKTATHQHKGT